VVEFGSLGRMLMPSNAYDRDAMRNCRINVGGYELRCRRRV
jgi:hypothetical protein